MKNLFENIADWENLFEFKLFNKKKKSKLSNEAKDKAAKKRFVNSSVYTKDSTGKKVLKKSGLQQGLSKHREKLYNKIDKNNLGSNDPKIMEKYKKSLGKNSAERRQKAAALNYQRKKGKKVVEEETKTAAKKAKKLSRNKKLMIAGAGLATAGYVANNIRKERKKAKENRSRYYYNNNDYDY
jgi:hypothetical protein